MLTTRGLALLGQDVGTYPTVQVPIAKEYDE